MIESEKETVKDSEQDVVCRPDDESFDLVVGMLLHENRMEAAFKYIDLNLKSGHSMSSNVFSECVFKFMASGSLDTLVSVIERCKVNVMKASVKVVDDISMPSYCFLT